MKVINFTAKEILPALLRREKTQTIRPAWRDWDKYMGRGLAQNLEKPARFAVGEMAKLMWKQRSLDQWFWKTNGEECDTPMIAGNDKFHKELGIAEITEVFRIKMGRDADGLRPFWVMDALGYFVPMDFVEELANRDGFDSAQKMFEWFDNAYDLSSPKPFWVYRWRWVSDAG